MKTDRELYLEYRRYTYRMYRREPCEHPGEEAHGAYLREQARYRERRRANQGRPLKEKEVLNTKLQRLYRIVRKVKLQGQYDELTRSYLDEMIETLESLGTHQG